MARPKFTIQPVQTAKPVTAVDRELLTKTVDDGVYPLAMAKEIRLDRLRPDPNQPRRTFDQARLEELAASIREQGILQPIVVEYVDEEDYFRIVHGERRYRASLLVGLRTIPAIVHKPDDTSRLVRQLIENIQREDLNDVDRALALKQLKVNLGSPSWDVVAQKVGISKRRVLQLMDTTKLPESVQDAIRGGQLTEKHGRAIKKLPADQQVDFASVIREEKLSGDESLEVAKMIASKPELPIAEAITIVKEVKESPRVKERPAGKERPTVKDRSPQREAETRPEPVTSAKQEVEPTGTGEVDALADLARLASVLGEIDPSEVDAARLDELLRQIIASAEALLAQLPPANDERTAPATLTNDHGSSQVADRRPDAGDAPTDGGRDGNQDGSEDRPEERADR